MPNLMIEDRKNLKNTFFICFLPILATILLFYFTSKATSIHNTEIAITSAQVRAINLVTGQTTEWQTQRFPIGAIRPWSKDPEEYEIKFLFDRDLIKSDRVYFFIPQLPHGGSIYINGELVGETSNQETTQLITYAYHPFVVDLNITSLKPGMNEVLIKTIVQDTGIVMPNGTWIGSINKIRKEFFLNLNVTHTARAFSAITMFTIIAFLTLILYFESKKGGGGKTRLVNAKKIIAICVGIFIYTLLFFPASFPANAIPILTIIQVFSLTSIIAALFYGWMMLIYAPVGRLIPILFVAGPAAVLLLYFGGVTEKAVAMELLSLYLAVLYSIPGLVMIRKLFSFKSLGDFLLWLCPITFYLILLPVVIHDFIVISGRLTPIHPFLTDVLHVPAFWTSSSLKVQYLSGPLIVALLAYVLIELINYGNLQRSLNETLQEKIEEKEIELKRSYTQIHEQEVSIARLNERSRIMRDLHDVLGSTLMIGTMNSRLPQFSARDANQLFQKAMNELRLMLNGFSGDEVSLIDAAETLVDQAKHATDGKINISLAINREMPNLGYEKTIHIIRIIQESLTNVIKHSGATVCQVTVDANATELWVTVKDNGIAFDYSKAIAVNAGKGLINVAHRAKELKAELKYYVDDGFNYILLRLFL